MEEDHRGRVTAEVGLGFGDLRGAKAAADDAESVLPRVVTDVTATRSDATPTPSSTFNFQSAALASLWRVVPPHPQQLYVLPTS